MDHGFRTKNTFKKVLESTVELLPLIGSYRETTLVQKLEGSDSLVATGGHILQRKLANFHSRNPKIRLRQGNDHPMIQLAMEFTGKASKFLAASWPPSSSHLKKNTSFWSVISKLICPTMCSRWYKSNWSTFSSFKLWIQILSVAKLRRKCKGDEGWTLKTLRLGCLMPWNTHNPRRLPQGKCARDPSRPMLTSVAAFWRGTSINSFTRRGLRWLILRLDWKEICKPITV